MIPGTWAGLGVLLVVGAQVPQGSQIAPSHDPDDSVVEWLHQLEEPGNQERLAAERALAGCLEGPEAGAVVLALLSSFEQSSLPARRARARLLSQGAQSNHLFACTVLASDVAGSVRQNLVDLLERPDLSSAPVGLREDMLAHLVLNDPLRAIRSRALDALGIVNTQAAASHLAQLVRTLPAPDRARAATNLAQTRQSQAAIYDLVQGGFGDGEPAGRTPADVLAPLLPAYCLHLVDRGDVRHMRVVPSSFRPVVASLQHPDQELVDAANRALGGMFARLAEQGDGVQALTMLDVLQDAGFDELMVQYHKARLALYPGGDPQSALRAAEAMGRLYRGDSASRAGPTSSPIMNAARVEQAFDAMPRRGRVWLFRAHYMAGMAQIGLGLLADAEQSFERAGSFIDAVRSNRWDWHGDGLRILYSEDLAHSALAELGLALVQLARGVDAREPHVLERLWRAYRHGLGMQLLHAELSGNSQGGLDVLLDSELSPYRLLFTRTPMPGMSIDRGLELQDKLGRAWATLVPKEVPGFEPLTGLGERSTALTVDPFPRRWLNEILNGHQSYLVRESERVQRAIKIDGGMGFDLQEENYTRLDQLRRAGAAVREQAIQLTTDPQTVQGELRRPATLALWLARDLREEGYPERGRMVAERMRSDLESQGLSNAWYFVGVERLVRADLVIGSCYTDEDEPLRAQETLLGAVERIDGVLARLNGAGVSEAALAPFRSLQSSALVSLAVNANVRLGQPKRALEYYERAYALSQDEFMNVLLACYRARSGRMDEAKRVLRRVRPGPRTWYNLACTYALMGESAAALDMLAAELDQNHSSQASRERQMAWAAADPDLASLRNDPRFLALTGQ